ncbi:N-acetylmuramoyl-L-alanine amidase CwlD [Sutcliffiella rhizosphaerae]|uniref:Germination-specific N-acetylmuramoyl-L-alanine amidase n=1 Tax=Sutcliffiella rhizosphaerae TaxID=2880967 RepID=A0ABM8YQ89_9BACI|nr:N-acetylmuramoyl-L-alanine amidase CwlD [Sutcliffiella rhizosphaerae]CAG9622179.1 Germination-specific N-acetylmuramoyl-L-alanine amidase [Sutcliffiella rhizosphaerae]
MKRWKFWAFLTAALTMAAIFQFQLFTKDTWEQWNLPLSGKIIILDPGHGGPDGGAVGGDILEKDIALQVSLYVKDYLQEQGALVLMTREDDVDLADPSTKGYSRRKVEDLRKRIEMINESDGDLFLSIHLNAIPSPRWRGAQTFYHSRNHEENARIAKFIQDEFRVNLENTNRYAKPISSLFILKNAEIPGTLVEVGFLSNPSERALLNTEDYQKSLAASIYNGVMRHYTEEAELPDPPQ